MVSSKYTVERMNREVIKMLLSFVAKKSLTSNQDISLALTEYPFSFTQIQQCTRRLKNRGLLMGSGKNGYAISPDGKKYLEDMSFSQLSPVSKWDKKWRVVIYDIPESKRNERDAVRNLLKQLGFYKLQISTWVHPLPCLNQFEQIRKASGLDSELILMEVMSISNQKILLSHFKKIYPTL
jgi:CRISPR-associated endonuclease Cas2